MLIDNYKTRENVLRYLTLLLVTIAMFGWGDSSNGTKNPDASPVIIPWIQHDAFYGIFSTAFNSGTVGDELFVQLAYGLSKVDLENSAAIYSRFNTPDVTR